MMKIKNRNLFILDVVIVLILVVVFLWGFQGVRYPIINSIFPILLGLIFLSSHKLRNELFVSKIFYWISENVLKPRTRINHLIAGGVLIFLGFLPTKPLDEAEEKFFTDIMETKEFWLGMVFVLIFCILVGLYAARQRKIRQTRNDSGKESNTNK